ncbi:MAG: methyltransferase domain-containing protein, partial [Pontixanthobacter sp.]
MRVLDVGCGNGDLSRLVARLVGPHGRIVGIDQDQAVLTAANAVAPDIDAAPIEYRVADISCELPDLGLFDAIIGRRVLMYLPDASQTLARLVTLAKPAAVFAFQEHS